MGHPPDAAERAEADAAALTNRLHREPKAANRC